MLTSIAEVKQKIAAGQALLLAGSETSLAGLPKGDWVGGTIPYFMDEKGGVCDESRIFVSEIPNFGGAVQTQFYTAASIPSICRDAPTHGFSVLILPASTPVHLAYAQGFPQFDRAFLNPVVGWVAGVHLSQLGKQQPKVYNGRTGRASSEEAVVMHVALPAGKEVQIDIVNVFHAGSGDAISFSGVGFSAKDCWINGKLANFAEYLKKTRQDTRSPLTADYNGATVNVSIQRVDESTGEVKFYAPVFPGVHYRFAAPVPDYVKAFRAAAENGENTSVFTCNCILNYLYAELEGKEVGNAFGPFTFGEVAHQLLNQTMVRLTICEV